MTSMRFTLLCGLVYFWAGFWAWSIDNITGYSAAQNDRFFGTFDSAPTENNDPAFLGDGVDLTGLGWNPANTTFQAPLLTSRHLLQSTHLGLNNSGSSFRFLDGSGTLRTYDKILTPTDNVTFSGQGAEVSGSNPDLGIGTLQERIDPAQVITPFAILDEPNAINDPVLMYARGGHASRTTPRLVETTIVQPSLFFRTVVAPQNNVAGDFFYTDVEEYSINVSGNSQGAILKEWITPDGERTFTVQGNTLASFEPADPNDTGSPSDGNYQFGFHSDLLDPVAVDAIQAILTPDGQAMRWVGNTDFDWQGDSSTDFATAGNWVQGSSFPGAADYAGFDSDTATSTTVDLGASNEAVRGLLIGPGNGGGFTFSATSATLEIGRGGIGNYEPDSADAPQFTLPLELSDHQHWFVKSATADLIVSGTINLGSHHLIISGQGDTTITGAITGTGGLTVDTPGIVTLGGTTSSTYSGDTWVYAGTLKVENTSGSSTGTGTLRIHPYGTVEWDGSNRVNDSTSVIIEEGLLNLNGFSDTVYNLTLNGGTIFQGELDAAAISVTEGLIEAQLSGSGSLTKTGPGTLTISAAGSRSGMTTISDGTLALINAGTLAGSSQVDIAFGAVLDVSGVFGNTYMTGPGQTLTGEGTINGNLQVDAILSPGNSPGTLTITNGNLTLAASATYEFEAGTTPDRVELSGGSLTLGGTLALTQASGFDPDATYNLFTGSASSPAGAFTSITGVPDFYTAYFDFNGGGGLYRIFFRSPFEVFQIQNFTPPELNNGSADGDNDFEGDGIDNATEFAFDLDPRTPDSFSVGTPSVTPGSPATFAFTFQRNIEKIDINYLVERDDDPAFPSPTIIVQAQGDSPPTGSGFSSETAGTIRTVTVEDPVTSSPNRAFYRVRAQFN